ncbi:hypothetical protein [Arachidicoccus ginsenosidimutans]|uniref:hypothetical protein n=1 Tax=Arachidicoccus sp. BS20 TaxID=1850526 RepID=UPI0012E71F21|nr:hypothetical protein [Arachidicoccus sp. BS20]
MEEKHLVLYQYFRLFLGWTRYSLNLCNRSKDKQPETILLKNMVKRKTATTRLFFA